jgi:membrane protease subunit HflC
VVGGLLLIVFVLLLFVFQVRRTEVAVVTTFGKPTRQITEPGPYLKWPWPIQKVHRFDQRIHNLESKLEQMVTADSININVKTYLGWRISEPAVFFPRFGSGSISKAEETLENLVSSAQNAVVGRHRFADFVSTDPATLKFTQIEEEILKQVQEQTRANPYGIEVEFLGIQRLALPESVTKLVFDRMEAERGVLVSRIKSDGEQQASAIVSSANLRSQQILAKAEAEAIGIRGQAEAEAAKSFHEFAKNPELANFLLGLSGLEALLRDRTTLLLDPTKLPVNLMESQKELAPSKR